MSADPLSVQVGDRFLAGGSTAGQAMRDFDWTTTTLGPPAQWPESVKTLVSMLLASGQPMFVAWGAQRTLLYNEPYAGLLGPRHPAAMGHPFFEVWPEVRDHVQPLVDKVFGGDSVQMDDIELHLRRDGITQAAHFSFFYSPVRDAQGDVAGLFCACNEITAQVQMQRQLRESEARYRAEHDRLAAMFQEAPGFLAVLQGPQHIFANFNAAYEQLVGHRNLRGLPAAVALPEVVEQGFIALLDQVYTRGEPFRGSSMEVSLNRTPDGPPAQAFVDFVFQPLRDATGDVYGIVVQGHEVTEQHRAQLELHDIGRRTRELVLQREFQLELADRLRSLATAKDVLAAATQLIGSRLDASRAFFTEIDDAADTFWIGSEWVRPGIARVAGPARKLSDFGAAVLAPLRRNEPIAIGDVALDERTSAHLQAFDAVNVRAEMAVPLVKDGRLQAVLVLHDDHPRAWSTQDVELTRDVAERTWAALESAQSQARLADERMQSQGILDSISEGFALFDSDWKILQINETGARIAGRRKEELIGRNHWQMFPLEGTQLGEMYRRVMQTGVAETLDYDYTQPTGPMIWVELRAYPQVQGRLAVFFRDISERKRAEREIAEASRRKDEFLAMLAHELRNPLAPIRSAAAVLSMGAFDAQRVQKTSAIITRQVQHMTSLVDDLLDVSRVTRGLVELERDRVDLRRVIAEAVEQVRPFLESRGHRLAVDLPPESPHVMGDAKRLVQVFANLLNNAAKYTASGGNVGLHMEVQPHLVMVKVSDDGIGMTPQTTSIAFDLFAQAERTSDRTQGGLGIGLALVKSLVGLHGGQVDAWSGGLGRGSVFTVSLPTAPGTPVVAKRADEEDAAVPTRALRVLVVDDNKDAADTLAMLVEAAGHTAVAQYDSVLALHHAGAHGPDVCLIDVGLPGMDGNELARALRADTTTASCYLVAVTGYGQEQDKALTAEAGFDRHLVKPVDPAEIRSVLSIVGASQAQ